MLNQGFGVVRVPTGSWADVKAEHPEWWEAPLFDEAQNRQHVICTINYIHVLCPMVEKVYALLLESRFIDGAAWRKKGLELFMPPGSSTACNDLFVVAEASSNIASNLTPASLRLIWAHYEQPVLWCGFNMAGQLTGSKGIVGDAKSLLLLGRCLARMKLHHIDQEYKALRGAFFELVAKNHICFGYLPHRSQCCDSSRGDAMPMTDEFRPDLRDIPEKAYFPCKAEFTVDEALASALRNETKVRGALDRYDIVCLRLHSYLVDGDPVSFGEDDRLSQVRAALEDAQLARHSARLEALVASSEPELWGQLDKALGIAEQELEAAKPQRADNVVDWCKNHSWLAAGDEDSQCKLLAMIQKGLSVHSLGTCLTCVHHDKQLWSLGACWEHFTVVKNFHRADADNIKEHADRLKQQSEQNDAEEDTTGDCVLSRFYGAPAFGLIKKWGWQPGRSLGKSGSELVTSQSDPFSSVGFSRRTGEFWETMSYTRGAKLSLLDRRVQRNSSGLPKPVRFVYGETRASTLPVDVEQEGQEPAATEDVEQEREWEQSAAAPSVTWKDLVEAGG